MVNLNLDKNQFDKVELNRIRMPIEQELSVRTT